MCVLSIIDIADLQLRICLSILQFREFGEKFAKQQIAGVAHYRADEQSQCDQFTKFLNVGRQFDCVARQTAISHTDTNDIAKIAVVKH